MSLNKNNKPVYGITPKTSYVSSSAGQASGSLGSDTNGLLIFTASPSGSRVYSLTFSTTDTSANNVYLYIKNGAKVMPISQINVPLSSGNLASTLVVDGLNPAVSVSLPIDNTGRRYIEMAANDQLKCALVANMTAAKKLFVTMMGADYT